MSEQQEEETEDKDGEMVGEKQILFNSAELKVDGTQPEKFTVKFLKTMEERFGKRDVGNEQERLKLVVKVHNEAHVAGPGLYQKIFRDGYYWPGMWSMCHDVAANCLTWTAAPSYPGRMQTAESLIFLFLGFLSVNNHTKKHLRIP